MGRGMGAEHTIPVMELIHRLKQALDKVQFAQQLLHAQTAQQVLSMGLTP
jgi:mannitol/fructose-specific phosphotransferase system IIA component